MNQSIIILFSSFQLEQSFNIINSSENIVVDFKDCISDLMIDFNQNASVNFLNLADKKNTYAEQKELALKLAEEYDYIAVFPNINLSYFLVKVMELLAYNTNINYNYASLLLLNNEDNIVKIVEEFN